MQTERQRRYRERIRQQGQTEVLLKLPLEAVEALDRMRAAEGVSSRGDVVASLIRQVMEAGNELTTA